MTHAPIILLSTPTGDTPTDITAEELTAVPTIACDCLVTEIETRATEPR